MLRLALIGCNNSGEQMGRVAPRLKNARFTAVVDRDLQIALSTAQLLGAEISVDSFDRLLNEHRTEFDGVVLQAGRLGEAGLLRIHSWKPRAGTIQQSRHADVPGIGLLLQRVVREIDLTIWLFGRRPNLVYAVGIRDPESRSNEYDYLQLHLGFAGGGMAVIDTTKTLPIGDGYFSLSVIGSSGAAYVDDHHNMQLLFGGGHPSALNTGESDLAALSQLQEFIHATEQNREPAITGADGMRAIEIGQAAATALATSEAVLLTGEF